MQIVIDIVDDDYNRINSYPDGKTFYPITARLYKAVKDGTPLPKGHGRLFDERDIVNGNYEIIGNRMYELEPVLEADKENTNIVEKNGEGKELFQDRINH